MLYQVACSVRSNAKAILKRILGSGEANGKAKVMFVKNMVRRGVLFRYGVLILPQRKYKQIVGMMEEEGWVVGVDWIDANTESAVEWKEPNGEGDESAVELSDDEADDDNRSRKSFSLFFRMPFLIPL
jgi:hypothetical protein